MYDKVLITLEDSEVSESALRHFEGLASALKIPKIVILNVVQPLSINAIGAIVLAGEKLLKQAEDTKFTESERCTNRIVKIFESKGISALGCTVVGDAVNVISSYLSKNLFDLVIMNNNRQSGISKRNTINIIYKIMCYRMIPILIIPPCEK